MASSRFVDDTLQFITIKKSKSQASVAISKADKGSRRQIKGQTSLIPSARCTQARTQ